MGIVIDLKTRVFDPNDVAYRLFPGMGYRHFLAMKQHSRVFLDAPYFPMPSKVGYEKEDSALTAIVRSEAMEPVVSANAESMSDELEGLSKEQFSNARWGSRRELFLGWVNGLYHHAKIGDLIVVPGPGLLEDNEGNLQRGYSLVGEIVGEPERWTEGGPENLLAGRYLTRRVRWLTEINELELDAKAAISLRTPNALIQLRARVFERALGAAYKNIVIDGEFLARFVIDNEEFTAFENFHFNAFVMAVVAACRKIENDGVEVPEGASIYDLAALVEKGDILVPEQEASIHSPGYLTVRQAKLMPAVLSALFALAQHPAAQPLDADGSGSDQVTVINSESTGFDPCELGVEQGVREALNILGYERWLQTQSACQRVGEDEGLRSITTVTTTDAEDE